MSVVNTSFFTIEPHIHGLLFLLIVRDLQKTFKENISKIFFEDTRNTSQSIPTGEAKVLIGKFEVPKQKVLTRKDLHTE